MGDENSESADERANRELMELLNELRVALPGVQVLFAFLLTIPFSQRFTELDANDKRVYFWAVLATAGATLCLIAPTADHRLRFRSGVKEQLLRVANALALVGLVLLAFAVSGRPTSSPTWSTRARCRGWWRASWPAPSSSSGSWCRCSTAASGRPSHTRRTAATDPETRQPPPPASGDRARRRLVGRHGGVAAARVRSSVAPSPRNDAPCIVARVAGPRSARRWSVAGRWGTSAVEWNSSSAASAGSTTPTRSARAPRRCG